MPVVLKPIVPSGSSGLGADLPLFSLLPIAFAPNSVKFPAKFIKSIMMNEIVLFKIMMMVPLLLDSLSWQ